MDPKIRGLIGLYKKNALNPAELRELYAFLQGDDHPIFDELINEEWDKTSLHSNEIDSTALLDNIYDTLALDKTKIPQPLRKPAQIKRNLLVISRYAAVLVIGIMLSFLFRDKVPLRILNQPKYFKIKVAYGSKSTIELPDSSLVILNSGSTLSYPERFGDNNRTVLLTGEGYFEVKKDKNRPFYVKTNDVTVKVLGTKFNVKAYPEENITETTLVTGIVQIIENKAPNTENKMISLVPNEKATYIKEIFIVSPVQQSKAANKHISLKPNPIALTVQKEVKTELYTAWKSNVLILNNEKFNDIVKKFERWYDVEITLESDQLSNIRFSAKFDRESIQEALEALKLVQSFNYKIHKNKISIFK